MKQQKWALGMIGMIFVMGISILAFSQEGFSGNSLTANALEGLSRDLVEGNSTSNDICNENMRDGRDIWARGCLDGEDPIEVMDFKTRYEWSCQAYNGEVNKCRQKKLSVGVCGSRLKSCTIGKYSSSPEDSATRNFWTCEGQNKQGNAICSKKKATPDYQSPSSSSGSSGSIYGSGSYGGYVPVNYPSDGSYGSVNSGGNIYGGGYVPIDYPSGGSASSSGGGSSSGGSTTNPKTTGSSGTPTASANLPASGVLGDTMKGNTPDIPGVLDWGWQEGGGCYVTGCQGVGKVIQNDDGSKTYFTGFRDGYKEVKINPNGTAFRKADTTADKNVYGDWIPVAGFSENNSSGQKQQIQETFFPENQ